MYVQCTLYNPSSFLSLNWCCLCFSSRSWKKILDPTNSLVGAIRKPFEGPIRGPFWGPSEGYFRSHWGARWWPSISPQRVHRLAHIGQMSSQVGGITNWLSMFQMRVLQKCNQELGQERGCEMLIHVDTVWCKFAWLLPVRTRHLFCIWDVEPTKRIWAEEEKASECQCFKWLCTDVQNQSEDLERWNWCLLTRPPKQISPHPSGRHNLRGFLATWFDSESFPHSAYVKIFATFATKGAVF